MRLVASLAALFGTFAFSLHADFSYQQTSRITGGSMVRMMKMIPGGGKALEPQVSSVLFHGNQMATVATSNINIIDIDKQVMTEVNLDKKTYSTITFAEFRQALDAMSKKMAQQMGKDPNAPVMEWRIEVKDGGESKTVSGLPTNLMKLLLATDIKDTKSGQTVTTNMNMDLWMAKDIAGYEEVRKFYQRYAEAVGITPEMMRMGRMSMGQPGLAEGMAKAMKEASKLQGVPVLSVTRMTGMGMPGMPEGATADPATSKRSSDKDASDVVADNAERNAESAASSAIRRIPGMGGVSLGGFGRKKSPPKEDPKPAEQPKPADPPKPAAPQQSVFMEMTSEMSGFSSSGVDASKFAVPAGFKEVEHEMKKALREMK
ncbi:MAG: hypothetical protein HY821_15435 [Acidobacteria bacterium]|nr:hypothetical protein [Acidobacteriota bacterium]